MRQSRDHLPNYSYLVWHISKAISFLGPIEVNYSIDSPAFLSSIADLVRCRSCPQNIVALGREREG
jgi:hypothetical protein